MSRFVPTGELPASARRHPPRYLLHPLRPFSRWIVQRRWRVDVVGGEHVPARGPVIMASNHVGVMDGPLLTIFAPRPVHALTKVEMFTGPLGWGLVRSGQIPLDRYRVDPRAIRLCLRVLRSDGVIGIFPEGARGAGEFDRFHLGAAYLALVTGAPIVPVVQFGTRAPGAGSNAMPPPDSKVEIVIGDPLYLDRQPWPRRHRDVVAATVRVRHHLRAHLAQAQRSTGRTLPGPLPADEPDPATGITDQEAS